MDPVTVGDVFVAVGTLLVGLVGFILSLRAWVTWSDKRDTRKQVEAELANRNPMLPFAEYLWPGDLWFFRHHMGMSVLEEWERAITSAYQPYGSRPQGIEAPAPKREEQCDCKDFMLGFHAPSTCPHKDEPEPKKELLPTEVQKARQPASTTIEDYVAITQPHRSITDSWYEMGFLLAPMRGYGERSGFTLGTRYEAIMGTNNGEKAMRLLHGLLIGREGAEIMDTLNTYLRVEVPQGDDPMYYPSASSLRGLVELYKQEQAQRIRGSAAPF